MDTGISSRFPVRIVIASLTVLTALVASGAPADRGDAALLRAEAVFGGGLNLPGGATFVPWAFDAIWKPHGASGAPGAGFVIECGTEGGENAADFGLLLSGRADFRDTGDGGVEGVWTLSANRDGNPRQVSIQTTVSKSDIPGGLRADDTFIAVSGEIPPSPHIFSGEVSRFEFLGAGGAPWLVLEFPEKTEILVQDNIRWGTQNVSLRLILASEKVEEGRECKVRAVFRVPDAQLTLVMPELMRTEAGPDWTPLPPMPRGTDWIAPGSALDFTGVVPHHEPAGKFGRVVAVGDHFELEGRPGEPFRFCGVNLVHGANVPEPESADRFAANLARMGFNAVRIHHHEAFLSGTKPRGDGAGLDVPPEAWEKFDALVAACIRHGLYITTDLFVSRSKGISWRAIGIDKPGAIPDREFKLMCAFYEPAYQNLAEWTRLFLTHVNPHTGRSLVEEPALCALSMINEGALGRDGIPGLLKCPGFLDAWRAWCKERGLKDNVPSDIYDNTGKRRDVAALALFLSEREIALFDRLRTLVRDELGCPVPLSNLSSGYYPAQYLVPMRDHDYIDQHFYACHPRFLGKNWAFPTVSEAVNPIAVNGGVPAAAWRRVQGKPFCITEWNWATPSPHRAASGLVVGALAALQDWSGLWRFAWAHNRNGVEEPGSLPMRFFDLATDPVQAASERATLCLFLRGDIEPLPPESESVETWRESDFSSLSIGAPQLGSPRKDASPWERRVSAQLLGDTTAPGSAGGPGSAGILPAESWSAGILPAESWSAGILPAESFAAPGENGSFRVVTPLTAGGFAESGALSCGPLSFKIIPASAGAEMSADPAAVWASSLDGAPLADSRRILLAHVTDAANSGAVFDGPEARSWIEQGTTPPLVRRGTAEIALAVSEGSSSPVVYRLAPDGSRAAVIPAQFDPASCTLSFTTDTGYDPACATFFYEIVRE